MPSNREYSEWCTYGPMTAGDEVWIENRIRLLWKDFTPSPPIAAFCTLVEPSKPPSDEAP